MKTIGMIYTLFPLWPWRLFINRIHGWGIADLMWKGTKIMNKVKKPLCIFIFAKIKPVKTLQSMDQPLHFSFLVTNDPDVCISYYPVVRKPWQPQQDLECFALQVHSVWNGARCGIIYNYMWEARISLQGKLVSVKRLLQWWSCGVHIRELMSEALGNSDMSPESENTSKGEKQETFFLLWGHFSGSGCCDMNPAKPKYPGWTVLLVLPTGHKKRRVHFFEV